MIPDTRREFLQRSATLGAAAALGLGPDAVTLQAADAGWFDRPMRWAQLNLTEDDPANMNLGFWLDYFKRIHADAVCLTAGGVVAFYPSKIPLHHHSEWLAGHESFLPDLIASCRKLNMVVMLRTDPHATYQDMYDAHPDWIAVDATGNKRRHWEVPEMWVTCALGPYNFDFMTGVTREIVANFKPDGIFSNRWEGSGMCYCEHCKANFRAASGMDLPGTNNPRDPVRREYIGWREKRLFELWKLWDTEIQKVNASSRYIANSGGGALSGLDMAHVGELAPTLFADRQGRSGNMAPWANGKNGKEYRATLGNKAIGGIFHMGVVTPYRWPDSVQNAAETRMWVLDGVANGLRPWFNKVSGSVHDERWLKVIEDLYTWHYKSERYLRNESPIARVGMVYSQQTATFYGGPQARQKVEDHTLGLYQTLIDRRIPFEMVHDRLLTADHVDRFKVLLLPNIAALSDRQCEHLRQYVQRGGSLMATYETSMYNEWGGQRKDFGLADVFGVSFRERMSGPIENSYLLVEKGKPHPLLAGLEDAKQLIGGTWQLKVQATANFDAAPVQAMPRYPSLPMEKNYPTGPRVTVPAVYSREIRGSRIVYFPWDIDRVYWDVMAEDHGKLLGNAIEWAANEEQPVTVIGPGILDVTAWRQKDSMTVHMVNLTNPMMMRGRFREFIPLPPQKVRVRLPEGLKARRVHLLVSGVKVSVQESKGYVSLVVPSITDHEVVAIDFV